MRPGRRGGAILMVVLLMFVLLALALTTLTIVAASAASVEREYRSSQALALAEAGLALARAEAAKPAPAAATRHFAEGDAAWSRVPRGSGWELKARGIVSTPAGGTIVRAVRANLERRQGRWVVLNWEGAK